MKVLILTCNTGGGHNSAAKAIASELKRHSIYCEIKDALTFVPKVKRDFIEKGHSFAYRHIPGLFGKGYEFAENHKNHYLLYLDYAKYALGLAAYIAVKEFDTAVCVHEFPAFMLTKARKTFKLKIAQYFVATDYSVAPGLEETDMDLYFIPKGFSYSFENIGIPKYKLIESGIPVNPDYYVKQAKRDARKELNIREDIPLALIGAGSIGCGPIMEIAKRLKELVGKNSYVVVLCGNNRKLKKELENTESSELFITLGFTKKVRTWINAADIMISKAGGLSTTEAASIGIPIILINAVPGLETHNLNYFVNNGMAETACGVDAICQKVLDLYHNPESGDCMVANQRKIFSTNATNEICSTISTSDRD